MGDQFKDRVQAHNIISESSIRHLCKRVFGDGGEKIGWLLVISKFGEYDSGSRRRQEADMLEGFIVYTACGARCKRS